jgi:hypothetical protein
MVNSTRPIPTIQAYLIESPLRLLSASYVQTLLTNSIVDSLSQIYTSCPALRLLQHSVAPLKTAGKCVGRKPMGRQCQEQISVDTCPYHGRTQRLIPLPPLARSRALYPASAGADPIPSGLRPPKPGTLGEPTHATNGDRAVQTIDQPDLPPPPVVMGRQCS